MKAVFVDSSVWIDHLRGLATPQVLALNDLLDAIDPDAGLLDPPSLLVGDLVLLEVLRGITDDRTYRRVRARMLAIPHVTLGGSETALAAPAPICTRTVRDTTTCEVTEWPIYGRTNMTTGARMDGSCIVAEDGTTTLKGPGRVRRVEGMGDLELRQVERQ